MSDNKFVRDWSHVIKDPKGQEILENMRNEFLKLSDDEQKRYLEKRYRENFQ